MRPQRTGNAAQEQVSDVIAANVREARRRRGWNTAALAEHCAKVGAEWLSDGVIRNIEHGRPRDGVRTRDITADELVALADALGMPPAMLMPGLAEGSGPASVDDGLFAIARAVGDLADAIRGARQLDSTAGKP